MSDFPTANAIVQPPVGTFGTLDMMCMAAQVDLANRQLATSAAAWPAANRALYFPCVVACASTVYKMGVMNGAVAGNVDIGLYDERGTRLTSAGSTVMAGASTVQSFDVADVTITAGVYYVAFVCSTVTTATFPRAPVPNLFLDAAGVKQEALGATTLPASMTGAVPAANFLPQVIAFYQGTTF